MSGTIPNFGLDFRLRGILSSVWIRSAEPALPVEKESR
jgi:hypothetical protein